MTEGVLSIHSVSGLARVQKANKYSIAQTVFSDLSGWHSQLEH